MLYPEIKEEFEEFVTECENNNTPEKFLSYADFDLVSIKSQIFGDLPVSLVQSRELITWLQTSAYVIHPTAVASSFLTIIGTLFARKVYTFTECSTTLYVAAIAPTGQGKDAALKNPEKLFSIISDPKRIINSSKIYGLGALDDIFRKHNVVTMLFDEFGDEIASLKKGGTSDLILKRFKELYSSTNGVYHSSRYSSAGGKIKTNFFAVQRPCLSISGISTRTQLVKSLTQEMASDGFLNRFIFLESEGLKATEIRDPQLNIPEDIINHMVKLDDIISDYINQSDEDILKIELSEDAKDYYFDGIGSSLKDGSDIYEFCNNGNVELNTEISVRWRENALRIATAITAYEIAEGDEIENVVISKEVLKWAYIFVKTANLNFYRTFFDEVGKNAWEQLVDEASKWFEGRYNKDNNEWITRTDVTSNCRAFRKQKGKAEKTKLLDELLSLGLIEKDGNKYRYKKS